MHFLGCLQLLPLVFNAENPFLRAHLNQSPDLNWGVRLSRREDGTSLSEWGDAEAQVNFMASFKSTSPVGKNHFSLGVWPIVLKYNGIFPHHFSKHKFVNVIKYCKFPLVQKSNVPFEIFIWKLSTRWFHNSPWASNGWPLLLFCSHSCL